MDKKLKEYMDGEFSIAITGMRDVSINPHERMYFMSATFGALSRVLNIEYDRGLVFAHLILQTAHQTIMNLINNCTNGSERAIKFHPIIINVLADYIEELSYALKGNKPIYESLEKISELAFSMTGNGHYLLRKEVIKITAPKDVNEKKSGNEKIE